MLNNHQLNSFPINQNFAIGSGSLVQVEQTVGLVASGIILGFEQNVELTVSGSGTMVEFEQVVQAVVSGPLVVAEQKVKTPVAVNIDEVRGWGVTLVVGGRIISNSTIVGSMLVDRTEAGAALLDVTIQPGAGVQDVESYIGQTVTLDVVQSGVTTRVYTGIVDIPELDIIGKTITLRCADRRQELINSQLGSTVKTIGSYSNIVFKGDVEDVAQELEQRLSTTPTAVDFDAYGNVRITPWAAKSTADFTLDNSGVFYRDPEVELINRGRILNQVNINFQFRYERLHKWERNFTWESPVARHFCKFLIDGYDLTRRDLITTAIKAAGWPLKGNITFDPIAKAGWYRCGSVTGGTIGFGTTSFVATNTVAKDSNGNDITADGNTQHSTSINGYTNIRNILCDGASWTASTRWAQTVEESYTLQVNAPQSQTEYGTISQTFRYAHEREYDSTAWEQTESYLDLNGQSGTYFVDAVTSRGDLNNAIAVALARAKTSILASHRDTKIKISRTLWPQIDLSHTVELTTTPIAGKGKVTSIKHRFNVSTGEAVTELELSLYKSQGSQSEDSLVAPTPVSDAITLPSDTIVLGNHFGEDPSTPAASGWTGFVGNKLVASQRRITNYTQQFIIDAPAVPDVARDLRQLTNSNSYNIEIPNDSLTITF